MMVRGNFGAANNRNDFKNKKKRVDFRSPIITERFLTLFLKIMANPKMTKRAILLNCQKFANQVPMTSYEKDPNVTALLMAVNTVIKNKIEGVVDKEELVECVNIDILDNYEDQKENIIFPTILGADEITDREKELVLNTIDAYLRYQTVLEEKEDLSDVLTDIGSGNISNLDDSLTKFRTIVSNLNDEFRKTDVAREAYTFSHTSEKKDFYEALENAYDYATSPRVVLHTGLKTLNTMLSTQGGFLGGKFYMFYADTNTFKSALLKYCTKWIQKYNGDMFKEDFLETGKRPTILYISLEDGEKEDTSRIFTTYTGKDLMNIDNWEEVEHVWNDAYDASKSVIDITQVNPTDASVNLATVDSFVKRLEEENYYVIAVVVDSFDLMAPSDDDIYRGITDDTTIFSNRAKAIQKYIADKPYPWITAHQLNRAGNQFIMEKKDKGVVDLAKTLGRAFISGAYDIERRVHWSAFIYTEWSKYDNELYLEIKREKVKYKKTPIDYMVHWLENGFVIHDDYGTDETLSRESILPTEQDFMQGAKDIGTRGITSIARMKETLGLQAQEPENQENVTPMISASTGGLPPPPQQFVFDYSVGTPYLFGYNPFNKPNVETDNSEYLMMPEICSVTPFNE